MRSGDFNCQVTIEKRVTTQDASYGTPVVTWTPLVTSGGAAVRFAAEVEDEPPSRSEQIKSGLAMATQRAVVRLRWRNDVDSSMRVTIHRDTAVVYQIIGGPAQVGGRKQMLEMLVERYSTAGTAPA
jgi:SPP1 family predicted phage head-tail adaptor